MTEDKKLNSSKRFAIISKESVKAYGESCGHSGISDEVGAVLAEDAMYRLREIVQASCRFMQHGRRKKLTPEDFNKALRTSDIPPVFGYGSSDAMAFRQTKEGDVHFVEDGEMNVANIAWGAHIPHKIGKTTVKAQWLTIEGLPRNLSTGSGISGKISIKHSLPDHLRQYFDSITKAVLCSDKELTKLALVDVRTNANISTLLPYFLNFIDMRVHSNKADIVQLTKLLHMVRAIVNNTSLFLQPKPYLSLLLDSVMHCITDPLVSASMQHADHWTLRAFAARLLAQIISVWDTAAQNLKQHYLQQFQQVLYDLERPLCSHYGTIMALCAYGTQAIEDILLPHLPCYMKHLDTMLGPTSSATTRVDATNVQGAIRLSCEFVLRAWTQHLLSSSSKPHTSTSNANPTSIADHSPPNTIAMSSKQPTLSAKPVPSGTMTTPIVNPLFSSTMAASIADPVSSNVIPTPITDPALSSTITAQISGSPLITDPALSSTITAQIAGDSPLITDTATSTKLKVEIAATDDLIGPVLQLPETTPAPKKTTTVLYSDFVDYFGDSLIARLPINIIPNYYIRVPIGKHLVQLYNDEDAKKSGEQLLEEILRRQSTLTSTGDSDDQTTDEDRSSRSDASDRFSRLAAAADLTVKVSDPSVGIKLTITKRPRKRNDPKGGSPTVKRRRHPPIISLADELFGVRPLLSTPTSASKFTFRFGNERKITGHKTTRKQESLVPEVQSIWYQFCCRNPTKGKLRKPVKDRWQRLHKYTATLESMI